MQFPATVRWQCFVAAALLTVCATARAELADRDKPVNVEADRLTMDDLKKESIFEGNVTVTQGTLLLKADKVTVRQDANGFNYASAYGKPAYFRQKREGYDEYIEGNAERLDYDGKANKMQMFTNAEVRKGADEVKGDYISYDAATEFYQVISGPSVASTTNPKGRVRAVIQPPKRTGDKTATDKPASPAPAPPPVSLKSSKSLRDKLEE